MSEQDNSNPTLQDIEYLNSPEIFLEKKQYWIERDNKNHVLCVDWFDKIYRSKVSNYDVEHWKQEPDVAITIVRIAITDIQTQILTDENKRKIALADKNTREWYVQYRAEENSSSLKTEPNNKANDPPPKENIEKVNKVNIDNSEKKEIQEKKNELDVKPIHPGKILKNRLLIPRDISYQHLGRILEIPEEQVRWICEEKMDINSSIANSLALYFDTSAELWLDLQRNYDKEQIKHHGKLWNHH